MARCCSIETMAIMTTPVAISRPMESGPPSSSSDEVELLEELASRGEEEELLL